MKKGKVFIVGAGPGDPGLLTLRAKEVLSTADAVLYDALIHPRILDFIPEKAQKIFRGHRSEKGALSQARINRLLVKLAKQGKAVVRLKGGDPFVFGRGAEEALELARNGIGFEIVPGVTSAVAVPAYAGIPLTHRSLNSSFTVVTGHEDPTKDNRRIDWKSLAENNGTLVFLMSLHRLPFLCGRLMSEGKKPHTPAAVVQWGTTSRQRTVSGTLRTLPELVEREKLEPPATLVVGKVVGLMKQLQWIPRKPLSGIRVLVTRGRGQAHALSSLLVERGAEVVEIPTIEIHPLTGSRALFRHVREAGTFDWIVFSSANAVEIFMKSLARAIRDPRDLHRVKIACVGEATADSLKGYGIRADLVPSDYKQEGLAKAFGKISMKGKKVLLARGQDGRDVLERSLRDQGAQVEVLALYKNQVPGVTKEGLHRLFGREGGVDIATFASSSAVDHFYSLFTPDQRKRWLRFLPVAAIGPITAASARKWGAKTVRQPKKYTVPELVRLMEKWVSRHEKGGRKTKTGMV
jgi:uroporphyrinogen III methyltransferase / synthase